jgi:hypothetical protein
VSGNKRRYSMLIDESDRSWVTKSSRKLGASWKIVQPFYGFSTSKHLVRILYALALLALLAACGQGDGTTPTSGGRHPFRVDMAGGDGA